MRLAPAPAADFPLHHHTFSPLDIAPCSCAALGVRITGVDDATFSQTGEAYSTIALPATDSHTALTLQEDDTALAYEAPNGHLTQKDDTRDDLCYLLTPNSFSPWQFARKFRLWHTAPTTTPTTHTHCTHPCTDSVPLCLQPDTRRIICRVRPLQVSNDLVLPLHNTLASLLCRFFARAEKGIHEVTARRFCLVAAGARCHRLA